MRKKTIIIVCLLVVSLLVASAVVMAKKPQPPPPPPGTVYYTQNSGVGGSMWSMNTDGSEKTQLGVYYGIDGVQYAFGDMSRLQHGGHYWFIRFETVGGHYPDGPLIREIFAVRDDGEAEVQLTDDPTLETCNHALALIWGIDDESIAWSGFKWEDGSIDWDSFGIYSADVTYGVNGDVTGLAEEPYLIWNTGSIVDSENPNRCIADVLRFDWSPDATKLVVAPYDWTQDLYIVEPQTSTVTPLGTTGYRVRWSPDGSKIAFCQSLELKTINPDGTDEQVIVASSFKRNSGKYVKEKIGWSPDSTHLLYTWIEVRYGNLADDYTHFVYRVEANGDNPTSMTDDLPDETFPLAHAWR